MNDLKLKLNKTTKGNQRMSFTVVATGYPQIQDFICAMEFALESTGENEVEVLEATPNKVKES